MTDPQHEETFADTERKLREIITTLRAQLAEARVKERQWIEKMVDAEARADRAEAALVAQMMEMDEMTDEELIARLRAYREHDERSGRMASFEVDECIAAADRVEEADRAFTNLQRHCQRQRNHIEALEKEWAYWRDECQKFRGAWIDEKARPDKCLEREALLEALLSKAAEVLRMALSYNTAMHRGASEFNKRILALLDEIEGAKQ